MDHFSPGRDDALRRFGAGSEPDGGKTVSGYSNVTGYFSPDSCLLDFRFSLRLGPTWYSGSGIRSFFSTPGGKSREVTLFASQEASLTIVLYVS